jgi:DNA-binding PadR family transcriptional regulator
MLRFLILGLLRSGRRLHGYALVKEYRERSGLDVKTGGFYRELQRLVRDQLIRGPTQHSGAGDRRMPYEITAAGIALFDEWLASPSAGSPAFSESDVSARALFLADAGREVTATTIEHMRANLWVWAKRLERERLIATSRSPAARSRGPASLLPLLLSRRIKQVAAELDLIDAVSTALGGSPAADAGQGSAVDPQLSQPVPATREIARSSSQRRARPASSAALRRTV